MSAAIQPGPASPLSTGAASGTDATTMPPSYALAAGRILETCDVQVYQRGRSVVESVARLLADLDLRFAAAAARAQRLGHIHLDPLGRQVSGNRAASVWTARRASALRFALGLLVLLIGDGLRDLRRHHELGHLGEGQLHLRGVDALALVLRTQVTLHALELDRDQLVELLVLVALVRGSLTLGSLTAQRRAEFCQFRFELLDPRVALGHRARGLTHRAADG